jgi:hypothetical protein
MSRRLIIAGAALTIATTAIAASAPAGPSGPDYAAQKLERSTALTMEDAPDRSAEATPLAAGREARAASDARAARVPLPDGGSFNGIRWESGEGVVHPAELEGVLEYNAACQWLRAYHDGRESAVAARVLADVPNWPALRGTDSGAYWEQAARELGGGGEITAGLQRECDESHVRESQHAASIGRLPSS